MSFQMSSLGVVPRTVLTLPSGNGTARARSSVAYQGSSRLGASLTGDQLCRDTVPVGLPG